MTFNSWLRKQVGRNDWIGDLSNDFIGSRKQSKALGSKYSSREELTLEEIESYGACERAKDAFIQARKEYELSRSDKKSEIKDTVADF